MTEAEFKEIEQAFYDIIKCYPPEANIYTLPEYSLYQRAKEKYMASVASKYSSKQEKFTQLLRKAGIEV